MMSTFLSLALLSASLKLVGEKPIGDRQFLTTAGGNYRYQLEYTTEGIGETPIARFSLYDRDGNHLATVLNPGIEMMFVSDAGWAVGGLNYFGKVKLKFYDTQGKVQTEREVNGPANYALSPKGSRFYVNSIEGITAFDAKGNVAARFATGSWFLPSDDDRLLATVSNDQVTVWQDNGTVLAQFRLGSFLFRNLRFSPDGQLLVVAERATLSLYSLSEKSLLWRVELPEGTSLLGVAVDSDGSVYVGGEVGSMADEGFLALYRDGAEQARVKVTYNARNEGLVNVGLDADGISVTLSDHILRYEVAK